ncbi:MAG: cellulase family glycosylhydrolase [Clostridia bacterium]|nr:cellulase family glycosylhydrolase [Clostridia bacterium]
MKLRGVNLGNWLSLEKWMQPELFEGIDGEDELDFFSLLPEKESCARLRKHYETYITEADFAFMAEAGVNLVRIPIPYYIFGEPGRPASVDCLDKAFDWAEKYAIRVLIDLHSVRGGQNGFDNSGSCGLCTWHKHPEYVEETLQLLERLAVRYAHRPALFGIGPVNEPASDHIMALNAFLFRDKYPERVARSEAVPDEFLKRFYLDVYRRLKPLLPENAVIVLSDQFDLSRWADFMPRDEFPGVWLDAHKYLTFSEGMFAYNGLPSGYAYHADGQEIHGGLIMENYLKLIRNVFLQDVLRAAEHHPVMVGEWCLVQNMEDIKNAAGDEEIRTLYRQLADAQMDAWDRVEGGVYWSYRVTDARPDAWDFRKCVRRGWLKYR